MKIFTIGFTKKTAETFFTKIRNSGARRIIDVRLNNVSQLSGFAKRDDLKFFAKELCHVDYVQVADLAPTDAMLSSYKKGGGDWQTYESDFLALMKQRRIEDRLERSLMDGGCLLCSEDKPHQCHRRLVAEYLKKEWGDVEISHLV